MPQRRSEDYHVYPTLCDSQRTNPKHAINWEGEGIATQVVQAILEGKDPDTVYRLYCPKPQAEVTQDSFFLLVDAVNPPSLVDILLLEPTKAELNLLVLPEWQDDQS